MNAMKHVLAEHRQIALAALARNLVQPVLGDHRATSALDVQARDCTEELLCQGQAGFEQCRAWQELGQMRDARDEGIRP